MNVGVLPVLNGAQGVGSDLRNWLAILKSDNL